MELKVINIMVQSGGSVLPYLTSMSNKGKEITHSNLLVLIPLFEAFIRYINGGWLVH